MKAGRQSSTAPYGHTGMVVIEDTKGNTTITPLMGTEIAHKTCKRSYMGKVCAFSLCGDILVPAGMLVFCCPLQHQSPPSKTTHVVLSLIPSLLS